LATYLVIDAFQKVSLLGERRQQLLAHSVISAAQQVAMVALSRCSVNGTAAPSVISLLCRHAPLLLQRSFPAPMGSSMFSSIADSSPINNGGCSSTNSGGGGGVNLPSSDVSRMSQLETDELFVVNLLAECLGLLSSRHASLRSDLALLAAAVLRHRPWQVSNNDV